MSQYTFTFKKDDIFVEFTTEDKDVVERQFQIWVADADEYAKKTGSKLKEKAVSPEPEKKAEIKEQDAEILEEKEPAQPQKVEEPQATPVFDKASTLLRTINSIQQEQDEIEIETKEPIESGEGFESVLYKTIENPTFQPEKPNDQIFLNLINSKNTTDKFHYLMITAYYLSEFKKQEKFSLKQINSVLMQNLSEVIDHSTLQEAINQGFIEVLPDLTGVAEVAEYRLTALGEEFFSKKI